MLLHLKVENFAVVEKVEIDFCPELNILTGETGAGKSIIVDAIKLFLDKKISGNFLRNRDKKLIVEALFIEKDEEIVLKREITDGARRRSVSFINGEVIPFQNMREAAERLLNIYGQHEYLFLLSPSNHLDYIDAFAENGKLLSLLSSVYSDLKRSEKELSQLIEKRKTSSEKLDFLNFRIEELKELDLNENIEEELEKRSKILSSSEEIMTGSTNILQTLYRDEDSVYTSLAAIKKDIEFLSGLDQDIEPYRREVENFFNMIPEFSSKLTFFAEGNEYDEKELDVLEEKLFKIKRLKEKYTTDSAGLVKKLKEMIEERDQLLNMDFSVRDVEKRIEDLFLKFREINEKLRAERKKKGKELSAIVISELEKLEMKQAEFIVSVTEREPDHSNITDKGSDLIEFLFSPNPGIKPDSIKNTASGGELSRLMLVLKSLITDENEKSYIFDEVDSGIGGKTADFVGKKLKEISKTNQVICISHLPQIAAFADKHFLVGKKIEQGQTFSFINSLSYNERIFEIARLMAGSSVNRDVEEAARQLVESRKE